MRNVRLAKGWGVAAEAGVRLSASLDSTKPGHHERHEKHENCEIPGGGRPLRRLTGSGERDVGLGFRWSRYLEALRAQWFPAFDELRLSGPSGKCRGDRGDGREIFGAWTQSVDQRVSGGSMPLRTVVRQRTVGRRHEETALRPGGGPYGCRYLISVCARCPDRAVAVE